MNNLQTKVANSKEMKAKSCHVIDLIHISLFFGCVVVWGVKLSFLWEQISIIITRNINAKTPFLSIEFDNSCTDIRS